VGGGRSVWMGRGCSRGIACLLVGRASATVFFFFSTAVWIPRFVFSLMSYLDKCIDRISAQNRGHYLEADCLQHLPHQQDGGNTQRL
jgi:hypothetical protein